MDEEILNMIRYQIRERYHRDIQNVPEPEIFLVVDLDYWHKLRAFANLGPVYWSPNPDVRAFRLDGALVTISEEITGWRVVS